VLVEARKLLSSYGAGYTGVLQKYPTQLSGGALAVAKLVHAQLRRSIKVLFLDEAFSGVQRDVWPGLITSLRRWREENDATIVAITHNAAEVEQWRPDGRFLVQDGRISRL
jgi:ABC-type thiamine transport system ATPase subunit